MHLEPKRSNPSGGTRVQVTVWVFALISVCTSPWLLSRAQTAGPTDVATAPLNGISVPAHANADDVSIDLVVRDKHKRPVLNLTQADIAVMDAGTPAQLSGLHLVTAQSGEEATIAMLFDHMTAESAKVAKDIAVKLVLMAPQQCSFAVLGLDRGLRLFQTFTRDHAEIEAATGLATDDTVRKDLTPAEKELVSVAQTGMLPSGSNASVEVRARARMMLSALEDSQRIVLDQHASLPLAGLEALARAQQNTAGRKIIVFFSPGLRSNSKTADMTKEVLQAANRAGIPIYTVDTNAVDSKSFDVLTMMYQPSHLPGPNIVAPPTANAPPVSTAPTGIYSPPDPSRIGMMGESMPDASSLSTAERDRRSAEGDALAFLAKGTGGLSISAEDNLRESLQHVIGDIATYYEATYTPALKDYDGQFHSIDIASLREGVNVRSRAGYFAVAPAVAGSGGVRPFDAPLLKILGDSPRPADVTFEQAILRLGGDSNRLDNELEIEVPVSHLDLREDEHTLLYTADASILAQIRDKSGAVIERFSEEFSRNGDSGDDRECPGRRSDAAETVHGGTGQLLA